ncbi:hypothetical protein COLO4_26072 [Corchorus olitorius]|uniref:Uncharacterized protein n=1 Tax=Corchorus olitorius TaxID=93759 RepID=A0A1R3HYP2_9ROSI|nr:hypothetical protein COLO4_26072 [Corchorus olitorius]
MAVDLRKDSTKKTTNHHKISIWHAKFKRFPVKNTEQIEEDKKRRKKRFTRALETLDC